MKILHTAFAVLLFGAGVAAISPTSATAEIGVFAAANQDLAGARPSEASRPLFIQDRVVANERIASSTEGGGQILFLDQSSLTISPNSEIVLDKYVYDADADSGEMGLTVLKGAMRLVGGRITKKTPAIIKTPTATIGIRGGMGSMVVGDNGVTRYMHIAGVSSTIQTDREELTITREGGFAEISPGGDIEYLGVAPDDFVSAAYSRRSSGSGSGGGEVRVEQTTEGVDDVEEIVSGDEDAVEQDAISTSGEQEDDSSDEETFETASNDADEESNENFIDDIEVNVDQEIDSLFVFGTFDATITADFDGNGSPGVAAVQEDFVFAYSLLRDQGFVLFTLPETGDDLSIDEETQADIAAVGLDGLLARLGAANAIDIEVPGIDGFLVSGFPLSGPSGALDPAAEENSTDNFAVSEVVVEDVAPDPIFIGPDNSGGASDIESFAGGAIQEVDFFVDEGRGLTGNFDISYENNPEFDSLDRVQGDVDIQLQELEGAAGDIDDVTDGIRVLIEEDDFDRGQDFPVSDSNV